jgi:glycosyltransferase involved in cell wall biosynthesis
VSARRKIAVVPDDLVGSRMATAGIRYLNFARELRTEGDVTLVSPYETDLEPDGFEIVVADRGDPVALASVLARADCVVAQRLPVPTMQKLARTGTRLIYDLYAPAHFEVLALDDRSALLELNALALTVALQTGDAFVCASETQRDLWLGALFQTRRIGRERYAHDPSLRSLIDVVPFGIDTDPPRPEPVLKGVVSGIGENDRVLLWGGGIWNWLDPLTVIDAVAELAQRRDDVRLVFLGLQHPNPHVPEMRMARDAVARAEALGLRDRVVFFNEGWVPYERRGAYLLEADLGVSAHIDDLESRFAFRTRLIDCLWARLPIVATVGDTVGELVVRRGLGCGVAVGDVAGWVRALEALLDDREAYERARTSIAAVREEYLWPRAVEPLRRLVREPGQRVPRRRTAGTAVAWTGWRLRHAVARRGALGTVRRLAQLARRSVWRRSIR